jgi:hypothetical protein
MTTQEIASEKARTAKVLRDLNLVLGWCAYCADVSSAALEHETQIEGWKAAQEWGYWNHIRPDAEDFATWHHDTEHGPQEEAG